MDYNNLYASGNFSARYGSTDLIDLAAWQAASSRDANSVSYYPSFTSATNLHTGSNWLNAKGTPLADVTDDIDGQVRDGFAPDLGADEYTPDPLTPPMSGTYVIGSASTGNTVSSAADFPTFDAAIAALVSRGVSGPVTVNVQSGTYQESMIFYPIPNSSSTNTITFQSENGNASTTTVYSVTTIDSNYVIFLTGADNIQFKNMTLRSNNNVGAQYGLVVYLWGSVDNFLLENCIVNGTSAANSSVNYTLVYSGGSLTRGLKLLGNTFNDGGYALYLDGVNTSQLSSGTQILDNTFNNPDYAGGFLRYQNAPILSGNRVVNADSRGFELQYCMNGLQITKNKISNDGGSAVGIYLYYCTGTSVEPGLTANNFVFCSASSATGIDLYASNYQRVVYNSVNMTGASTNAFYTYAGSSNTNNIVNNNFANHGGGYTYYIQSPEGVGLSNYNNHYTTGSTLAYWGGNRATLADLQSASSKEGNSKSVLPGFYSASNLHTISPPLDSAGAVIADITDDIDGDLRDPNSPDIGADEFSIIITVSPEIPGGWNMVSLPLIVANNLKTVLFPTANSNAFAYEPPAGYVTKDSIKNMAGYWLKFPSTQTISVTGAPLLRDSVSTRAGWNLIGAIAVPVPKTAVIQNPVANVASNYFEYVPGVGYIPADTLKPGRAFWVKTTNVGKLTLDVNAVLPKTSAGIAGENSSELDMMNQLVFKPAGQSGITREAILYFGSAGSNKLNLDSYTLPPPPPTEAADIRFASGRFVEVVGEQKEIPVVVQGQGTSFTVSWTIRDQQEYSYVIVERSGGKVTREQQLRGSGTMTVSSDKQYVIRLLELPTAFTLHQNYPNPFNPSTAVRFDLPEQANVTLKVFNLLGQELTVPLENAELERGAHIVNIDARSWASGTYIYRLQAVGAHGAVLTASKKMVLIK